MKALENEQENSRLRDDNHKNQIKALNKEINGQRKLLNKQVDNQVEIDKNNHRFVLQKENNAHELAMKGLEIIERKVPDAANHAGAAEDEADNVRSEG